MIIWLTQEMWLAIHRANALMPVCVIGMQQALLYILYAALTSLSLQELCSLTCRMLCAAAHHNTQHQPPLPFLFLHHLVELLLHDWLDQPNHLLEDGCRQLWPHQTQQTIDHHPLRKRQQGARGGWVGQAGGRARIQTDTDGRELPS